MTVPVPHHSSFLQAGCPSCRPSNCVISLVNTFCELHWLPIQWHIIFKHASLTFSVIHSETSLCFSRLHIPYHPSMFSGRLLLVSSNLLLVPLTYVIFGSRSFCAAAPSSQLFTTLSLPQSQSVHLNVLLTYRIYLYVNSHLSKTSQIFLCMLNIAMTLSLWPYSTSCASNLMDDIIFLHNSQT